MNIIQTNRFIDISDLPEAASEAYSEFCCECGVHNGEPWGWEVGAVGDDSTPESWIGREKCDIINNALREAGLKDGDTIDLVRKW